LTSPEQNEVFSNDSVAGQVLTNLKLTGEQT